MKRILSVILVLILMFSCSACTKNTSSSSFQIIFIDVGQGDSALVECDGRYMLIDGGDVQAGDKVYQVLVDNGVQKLDILAMSHLHSDHIGGLRKALKYASSIGLTISNKTEDDSRIFKEVEEQLTINKAKIIVPQVGDKYSLGSAEVEVVDVESENDNDSLVLMITYGKTKFMFTGDIEFEGQKRIVDKYQNDDDKEYKIDLMKMPHHGSSEGDLYRFVRTFMPDYAIISCGSGNRYGHPDQKTLNILDNEAYKAKILRTDRNGSITVRSDGNNISVVTEK